MKFGDALELCRKGARIYRTGWNGKNQFVYYQKAALLAVRDLSCAAIRNWAKHRMPYVNIMGHFDIKTTADVVQCGWLASQGDMQAEDWDIFDET